MTGHQAALPGLEPGEVLGQLTVYDVAPPAPCPPECLLDCPYCHRHVIDTYSHLRFSPCPQAKEAGDARGA